MRRCTLQGQAGTANPLAALRVVPVAAPAVRPRSIAAKAKAKQLPAPPAEAPTKVMKVSKAEVDAHLGVAVALLPGRIASAHVSLVVGELLHKLAGTPIVGLPVQCELGELFTSRFCRESLVQCARVYLEMQADAHHTLLNSGDPIVAAKPENFMAVGVCKWDETEQHMQLRATGCRTRFRCSAVISMLRGAAKALRAWRCKLSSRNPLFTSST